MLGTRAGEVDLDLVARDRDCGADRQLALCRLEHVLGLVATVWQSRERRAHDSLRVRVELVHRRGNDLAAAPHAELLESLLRQAVRGELSAKVTAPLFGVSHAFDDVGQRRLVETRRRDHDALLVERARLRRHRAGLDRADVRVVRTGDGEAERRARHHRHVGQVRPARERVVQDPDLAGRRVMGGDCGDRVGHRAEVDGDVLRLRDHPAALVEERSRAVPALLDVGGERGANQHGAHLLRDRAEGLAENLELNVHGPVTLSSLSAC